MKVIAIKEGYFEDGIKRVGEAFEYPLKKGEKMPSWMRKAELTEKELAEREQDEIAAEEARIKAEKEAAEAKELTEKFNELKVKAEAIGVTVENKKDLLLLNWLKNTLKQLKKKKLK